jgi:hypothetical protein
LFCCNIFMVIFFRKGGSLVFSLGVKHAACFFPLLSSFGEKPAAVKSFFGIFLW